MEQEQEHKKKPFFLKRIYDENYKLLLIIPLLLLVLSIAQIGLQYTTTGDFINKGVSLKGGLTISVEKSANVEELQNFLNNKFPTADISVRALSRTGVQVGTIIESSDADTNELLRTLEERLDIKKDQYSVEEMGGSLGASFFKETFKALYVAFLAMGLVVFLYFGKSLKYKIISVVLTLIAALFILKFNSVILDIIAYIIGAILLLIYFINSIPSLAVILSAFSDIVVTVAIINIIGMKLSTSGIAAFLMLIGYSVDTDILLSTKVIKTREGSILSRVFIAMKTGLTMSITTIAAITVALIFAQSDVLKQIMTILLIGLLIDLINTWIQNAGILRWYMEKTEHKNE